VTTLTFKTNVKCNGCKQAIAKYLDEDPGIQSWRVDIFDPDRLLTVQGEEVTAEKVISLLRQAGYSGELVA
jgi:copper chaperone